HKIQRHFAVQIVAIALENSVSFHANFNIQIPWRAAFCARLATAGNPDSIAIVHTRRNATIFFPRVLNAAFTVTIVARSFDLLASAMASRASLLNAKEPLLHAYLPHASTSRTRHRLRAIFGARALAGVTIIPARHANSFCGTTHCLLKGDFHGVTQISAARRATTAGATKNIA